MRTAERVGAMRPKPDPRDEETWLSYIGLVGMNTALILAAFSWAILGLCATPFAMLPRDQLVRVNDMGIDGYVTHSVDNLCQNINYGVVIVFSLGVISLIAHVVRTRNDVKEQRVPYQPWDQNGRRPSVTQVPPIATEPVHSPEPPDTHAKGEDVVRGHAHGHRHGHALGRHGNGDGRGHGGGHSERRGAPSPQPEDPTTRSG